ncbi:hypothetical protein ROHU_024637 [Labeo rohita]|uniref:Uncharacterized protein n=1 Tax=Labeo rohita TaxID=84645 RepID=A0A498MWA4_LABRO|nr:hypothetical protein ROHU_024637 [Labeo rohita]
MESNSHQATMRGRSEQLPISMFCATAASTTSTSTALSSTSTALPMQTTASSSPSSIVNSLGPPSARRDPKSLSESPGARGENLFRCDKELISGSPEPRQRWTPHTSIMLM